MRLLVAPLLALVSMAAPAQSVTLNGSMGDKALLVINGTPRTLAAGATQQGVKLINVDAHTALVEIGGKRVGLTLGASPVNLGGEDTPSRILVTAGEGGHFLPEGAINGKRVRFLVDTGSTSIALGQAEADRLGLDYKNGQRRVAATANGEIAVYRTVLAAVRIGNVEVHNVEADVGPGAMGDVLLGNSFLSRFQMLRVDNLLTLELRR
jgi:aspartyl protease family protein